ncbi:hypothetical protein AUP68_13777 [Ilyonectria robusta]
MASKGKDFIVSKTKGRRQETWFTLFGKPSETESWGYMFFGHHLGLNVFVNRQQMVIGPVFLGAEPCESGK